MYRLVLHFLSRSHSLFFFLSRALHFLPSMAASTAMATRRYRLSIPLLTRYQTRYKAQPNTVAPEPLWAWHAPKADSSVSTAGRPAICRLATLAKKLHSGAPLCTSGFTFFATAAFCARERTRDSDVDQQTREMHRESEFDSFMYRKIWTELKNYIIVIYFKTKH